MKILLNGKIFRYFRDDTTNFLKHLKWVSVYCMYVLLKANQEIQFKSFEGELGEHPAQLC